MTLQKAVGIDGKTGLPVMVDLTPDELAEVTAKQEAFAAIQASVAQEQANTAKIIDAMPTKSEVKAVKSITDLADQVAKQGELLALIAAKLGLV